MKPLVAVVDTNVLVSALLTRDADAATVGIVERMLRGRLSYVLSRALISEYRSVLLRPKIARAHGRSEAQIDALLTDLIANAIMREPEGCGEGAPDPGDAHLWALAEEQPGAVLVTGDRLLLQSRPEGASVLCPRAFLDLMDSKP